MIVIVFLFVHLVSSAHAATHSLSLKEKLKHLDAAGTIIFLGSIVPLLLVLQWGGQRIAWGSATSIGLFVCSGVFLLIFVFLQDYLGEYATIPPRIVKMRSIYMGNLVLFVLGISSIALAYYLPVFFQSAQGVSATAAGIRMIAFVAPSIFAIGLTGAAVSRTGHYIPYMIIGIVISSVAGGVLTTLRFDTSVATWAAVIVVHRLGMGMAQQLPYTAIQAVLEPKDTATGNALAVFSWQLGGAIAVSIGQNLLLNRLKTIVPQRTNAVAAQEVIEAGAGGLVKVAPNLSVLRQLREAYAESLVPIWILALVATCLAILPTLGMEWLNIKRVAHDRHENSQEDKEGLV